MKVEDLLPLAVAKNILDGQTRSTCSKPIATTFATDTIVNMTSCSIMINLDTSKHLFFMFQCYTYQTWLSCGSPNNFDFKKLEEMITDQFPWRYQKRNLLKTRCIAFPSSHLEHYLVMFVLNVNLLFEDE